MARPGSLWTDQELIQRMRADDHFAYREYFARFQPLLVDRARLLGVQPALRDEMAMDTLGDAAMTLTRYTRPVPQSLTGYLVRALHHRAARAARGESMGSDAEEDDGEVIARASGSRASARASQPLGTEPAPLLPALERLASALDDGLSEEERMILSWVSHWVPQREIAEWLGVSHGAIRIRIFRLRERLRDAALQYNMRASAAEQLALQDFFRRTASLPCPENNEHVERDHGLGKPRRVAEGAPAAKRARRRDKEQL